MNKIVACALTAVAAVFNGVKEQTLAKKDRKFFYMDLTRHQNHKYSSSVLVGSEHDQFDLRFSSRQLQIGIFTDYCSDSQCDVPKSISTDELQSYTRDYDRGAIPFSEIDAVDPDTGKLLYDDLNGYEWNGKFTFQLWVAKREVQS